MKQGWEIKKLGEVCEVITKGTTPTSLGFKFTDEGVNFIKVESLTESGQIIPNKVAYISEECHESLKRSQLKENDILFSIAGALGRIGIVNKAIVPANTNQALAIVRLAKNSGISVSFLAKYFTSNIISEEIEKLKGGAAQQNLSLGQLNNLPIPLPPLPEQQRIVAVLEEAFNAIAKAKTNAEQNLKNTRELFESYLQELFENKGEGWEEKRLEEICFKITDGSHNPPKGIDYSEYLMISSKNVNNDFIDLDSPRYLKKEDFISENKRTEVIEGDVLLTIVGTIGRVAVVTNEHKYFTLQRSVAVLKPKKDFISSRFLMFSLRNIFEELNENARGVAQKGLYLNQIRSLEISIPKLKTQQIIVEKIDFLLAETKKLESIYQQKINDLEELKKSVLQKAFSGELKTAKALV